MSCFELVRRQSFIGNGHITRGNLPMDCSISPATPGKLRWPIRSTTRCKPVWKKRSVTSVCWRPYTWSRSIDNSSGFFDAINPFNPGSSRALSIFDVTHNFVVSYGYDLPFTRSSSGVRGKLLSGWTISEITRFATGFPITVTESDDQSLCGCSGADVPKYNGQPIGYLDPRKPGHQYFDPPIRISRSARVSSSTFSERVKAGPNY
jgi:hypothetical protein